MELTKFFVSSVVGHLSEIPLDQLFALGIGCCLCFAGLLVLLRQFRRGFWFGSALPFTYSFVRNEMNDMLAKEGQLSYLLTLGALLIIIISSLGLLGLIAHQAANRTKEIGIRKVVGADYWQLFWVLTREFINTYFLALLVGSSLTWYLSSAWLSEYAYRVHFQWSNLLVAGGIGLVIMLLTLGIHTFRVIRANPVERLRYE